MRLFVTILMQLKIKQGIKAEIGALYRLILLRPLEITILEPVILTVTLSAIKKISSLPQIQVSI